jgi:hypothetical protein
MKLTSAERRTLREVFNAAIQSEQALLGGYFTEIDPDDYRLNRIPSDLKADARRAERNIARYRRLAAKLLGT